MADKRDMLDDLIDIQRDWRKVSNPLGDLARGLAADPSGVKTFNPADYKEHPRANSVFCLDVASKRRDVCRRCLDVCPVDAIEIGESSVRVADGCRKCGLCTMVCPTEALPVQRIMAKALYDKVARAAQIHERCYLTCTRALGRLPKDNEIVLPCVGAVPSELWFSLLAEYDNVDVYLPLGICDRCRTTTGEEAYATQIARAEELTGASVGLEVEEGDLNHEQSRAYKRSQFMGQMVRAGQSLAATANPALGGIQAVARRIQQHSNQIYEMQRSLERTVGGKTSGNRRRILTQKRKMMLTAIQHHPGLSRDLELRVPVCDPTLCTMCGACVTACPPHACDLDERGHFSVEPAYCVNCGACATVCPEHALAMEPCDPQDLVIRDEEAERRRKSAERQRAQVALARERGRRRLEHGLDALERLADE